MTHEKEVILLDVDGVLGDFVTPALQVANQLAGTNYTHDDVNEWDFMALPGLKQHEPAVWEVINQPGWAQSVAPYEGAQEAVRELQKFCDVCVVTAAVASPTWVHDRNAWLYDHFGIERKHVIYAYEKFRVCGSALVDDKYSNVVEWERAHPEKQGLLFRRPWNEKEYQAHNSAPGRQMLTAKSWADVVTFARFCPKAARA